MNCLHFFPRSSALPVHSFEAFARTKPYSAFSSLNVVNAVDLPRIFTAKAVSGSTSNTEMENVEGDEEKSEVYSNNMTEAMGAVLTYRHELGMNYNFIRPDLIVGSCLQTPEDVDKLRSIGVKTIFCLQQDSDLEYFGVDITAIREYAGPYDDIQHIRAEIRDFDAFDLRMRLPAVVSKLHKAINRNGGVAYIHCTAGLGRAPATALAYMFWIQGYKLNEATSLLLSKRSCFPKLDAIKSATVDILTGLRKKLVTLTWKANNISSVEVSGLDIGWGQRIPLTYDKAQGLWILQRELPEGRYEYKYIIDGQWTCNSSELLTPTNKDGQVNNYIQDPKGSLSEINRDIDERLIMKKRNTMIEVSNEDTSSDTTVLWGRMMGSDPYLTKDERVKIRQFLEAYPEDK